MTNRVQMFAGIIAAIGITSAMDASGLSVFSALPLAVLLPVLWIVGKHSRISMGFVMGRPKDYALAIAYPLIVAGLCSGISLMSANANLDSMLEVSVFKNFLLMTISTIVMATITEEGFFRGWLWRVLKLEKFSQLNILLISSLIFTIWHISAVSLETGFDIPAAQIPVYLINAFFMGTAWGILRLMSGSIIVASVSHGLWNGLAYTLFGFGDKNGALQISDTGIYGMEIGYFGLLVNGLIVSAFVFYWFKSTNSEPETH